MKICSRCAAHNQNDARFCANCALAFVITPKKNTITTPIAILIAVVSMCGLCGVIGSIGSLVKKDDSPKLTEANQNNNLPLTITPSITQKVFVNYSLLAKKSPADVEKLLGKAVSIDKITKSPENMPGEYREYKLPEIENNLTVRFYKNQAVHFMLDLPLSAAKDDAMEVVASCGIDVSKAKVEEYPITKKWRGRFNGVEFSEISATKINNKYSIVHATVLDEKTKNELAILGEKPESSAWDGRVQPAVDYLRQNLNDYDSSEFVKWSPVVKSTYGKQPAWEVELRLRAKNPVGAFIVKDVVFYIQQNRVIAVDGL